MLQLIQDNWPIFTSICLIGLVIVRVNFKTDQCEKDIEKLEERLNMEIAKVQEDYANEVKELKKDMKENNELLQKMNLALVSLTSFLQGKGVCEGEVK